MTDYQCEIKSQKHRKSKVTSKKSELSYNVWVNRDDVKLTVMKVEIFNL